MSLETSHIFKGTNRKAVVGPKPPKKYFVKGLFTKLHGHMTGSLFQKPLFRPQQSLSWYSTWLYAKWIDH
ncbi:MAG: hypothetical protein EA409_11215 [Saprospirales bacterium]|nr:MAG: hypothetical protein EA409_11215 [Saprospirales bacterium]